MTRGAVDRLKLRYVHIRLSNQTSYPSHAFILGSCSTREYIVKRGALAEKRHGRAQRACEMLGCRDWTARRGGLDRTLHIQLDSAVDDIERMLGAQAKSERGAGIHR